MSPRKAAMRILKLDAEGKTIRDIVYDFLDGAELTPTQTVQFAGIVKRHVLHVLNDCKHCKNNPHLCDFPFIMAIQKHGGNNEIAAEVYYPCAQFLATDAGAQLQRKILITQATLDKFSK